MDAKQRIVVDYYAESACILMDLCKPEAFLSQFSSMLPRHARDPVVFDGIRRALEARALGKRDSIPRFDRVCVPIEAIPACITVGPVYTLHCPDRKWAIVTFPSADAARRAVAILPFAYPHFP